MEASNLRPVLIGSEWRLLVGSLADKMGSEGFQDGYVKHPQRFQEGNDGELRDSKMGLIGTMGIPINSDCEGIRIIGIIVIPGFHLLDLQQD